MSAAPPLVESRDNCGICLEKYISKTSLDQCVHLYCFNCIETWTRTANTCPECRARISRLTVVDEKRTVPVARREMRDSDWFRDWYRNWHLDEEAERAEHAAVMRAIQRLESGEPGLGGYVNDGGFVVRDDVVEYENGVAVGTTPRRNIPRNPDQQQHGNDEPQAEEEEAATDELPPHILEQHGSYPFDGRSAAQMRRVQAGLEHSRAAGYGYRVGRGVPSLAPPQEEFEYSDEEDEEDEEDIDEDAEYDEEDVEYEEQRAYPSGSFFTITHVHQHIFRHTTTPTPAGPVLRSAVAVATAATARATAHASPHPDEVSDESSAKSSNCEESSSAYNNSEEEPSSSDRVAVPAPPPPPPPPSLLVRSRRAVAVCKDQAPAKRLRRK